MTSTDRYRLTDRSLPSGKESIAKRDEASRLERSIREADDDAESDLAEIRYSLTALGEAALAEGDDRGCGPRFRGFGPCGAVARPEAVARGVDRARRR
jgi:hypothetical protein